MRPTSLVVFASFLLLNPCLFSTSVMQTDRRDFENHLASKFAAENIVFWDDTMLFEDMYDVRDDQGVRQKEDEVNVVL